MASGPSKAGKARQSRRPTPTAAGLTAFRHLQSNRLYVAKDHGQPITIEPAGFAPEQRDGGWGSFADSFMKLNQTALRALDCQTTLRAGPRGAQLQILPGGSAGAVSLRSAQTGHVVGGLVVAPRFGWAGVGQVLSATGWHAMPQFMDLPLVPGSGREVPPWVLAGPVLMRLHRLLAALQKGYDQVTENRQQPRGTILWSDYLRQSLPSGHWDRVPCRFPDLRTDPRLRQQIRWTLERIRLEVLRVGHRDPIAQSLAALATQLLALVADVAPLPPRREELRPRLASRSLDVPLLRQGLEAISWVTESRGLGGGQERDGLAWSLPLDRLWEGYVEAVYRQEAARIGADLKVGRRGETTFPLQWSDPSYRSLGHLVPDLVMRRGQAVQIVDAKYKAHLAELDAVGWHRFAEESSAAHRADIHQVLAYASLYDAAEITATLVYPLRFDTWRELQERKRAIAVAELQHGGRRIRLELRGLPFGIAQ